MRLSQLSKEKLTEIKHTEEAEAASVALRGSVAMPVAREDYSRAGKLIPGFTG
jgi:hypothetical protein